jgi:oleate hydratase
MIGRRRFGDRPRVRPAGAENFAIMGQYCEIPHDTVFTVEYSVRSVMVAVHEMTGLGPEADRAPSSASDIQADVRRDG